VIGFFPDVGATHFLNRLPGRLGVCAALTGLRLRGRELRDVGLATHFVEAAALPVLAERLAGLSSAASNFDAVSNALREHESPVMCARSAAHALRNALNALRIALITALTRVHRAAWGAG
jgi:enoyl-CoA hydratase/carnithine racemase